MHQDNRQRIVMVLEFDGQSFHGWQRQQNADSVQQVLEAALQRIEGRPVATVAAGRTDAGVHAEALAVHADVDARRWQRQPRAYLHGCNSLLPESVRVIGLRAVAHDFHARFDCRGRSYCYRIWQRGTASALEQWRHWWMPRPLELDRMRDAARLCMGERDFAAFQAAGCQAGHARRRITRLEIVRDGYCVRIEVSANAFVYHMVRNLVGNLVEVGIGKRSVEEFGELLQGRDRSRGAATAPAHGLYFTDAIYDEFTARSLIDCV